MSDPAVTNGDDSKPRNSWLPNLTAFSLQPKHLRWPPFCAVCAFCGQSPPITDDRTPITVLLPSGASGAGCASRRGSFVAFAFRKVSLLLVFLRFRFFCAGTFHLCVGTRCLFGDFSDARRGNQERNDEK